MAFFKQAPKNVGAIVQEFLAGQKLRPDVVDANIIRVAVKGKNVNLSPVLVIREDAGQLIICCSGDGRVAPGDRPAAAELIARINWNQALGNFDLDLSDGEIRYKTVATVGPGGQMTVGMVDVHFFTCVVAMDDHFPILRAFLTSAPT